MLRARGLTEHLAFGRKADNPAGHPTAPPAVQIRNQVRLRLRVRLGLGLGLANPNLNPNPNPNTNPNPNPNPNRNQGGIASTAGYNPKQQSARLGKPHALVRID